MLRFFDQPPGYAKSSSLPKKVSSRSENVSRTIQRSNKCDRLLDEVRKTFGVSRSRCSITNKSHHRFGFSLISHPWRAGSFTIRAPCLESDSSHRHRSNPDVSADDRRGKEREGSMKRIRHQDSEKMAGIRKRRAQARDGRQGETFLHEKSGEAEI
jgi:hypothetical protein